MCNRIGYDPRECRFTRPVRTEQEIDLDLVLTAVLDCTALGHSVVLDLWAEDERVSDKYSRFTDLATGEVYGVDYRICLTDRNSPIAIVAPHGGTIEGGTSEISSAIARNDHSIYCFEGLIAGRRHTALHLRSELFDEPQGCNLVAAADIAIGIHGRADKDDTETISMGGRDIALRDEIATALRSAGFKVAIAAKALRGEDQNNICNRGRRKEGVQLEIPKTLRDRLVADRGFRVSFAEAVRGELAQRMRAL